MSWSWASQAEIRIHNTEQPRQAEREGARENSRNTRKIDSEDYRTSQIYSCDEIDAYPCKDIRIVYQVSDPQEKSNFVSACV